MTREEAIAAVDAYNAAYRAAYGGAAYAYRAAADAANAAYRAELTRINEEYPQ